MTTDTAKASITPALVGARAYNSGNVSINNTTTTQLTFNSERFDSDAFHDTVSNTGRLTIPTAYGGYYILGANIEWAVNGTGVRITQIRLNGSTIIAVQLTPAGATYDLAQSVATLYQFAAADYADCAVHQSSGGSLNVQATSAYSPEFWIHRLSST